jgi:hypothetical protein
MVLKTDMHCCPSLSTPESRLHCGQFILGPPQYWRVANSTRAAPRGWCSMSCPEGCSSGSLPSYTRRRNPASQA